MLPDPLHPAIVHFPIVFAVLAPIAAVGAFLTIRRGMRPRRAWMVPLAALGMLAASAWVAVQTGEREEDRVERVVGEQPLHEHEEAAEQFLLASAAVFVLALTGLMRGGVGTAGRIVGTGGAFVLVALGYNVGSSGGALVYEHGAAQAYASPARGGAPARGTTDEDSEAMRLDMREARMHYAQILPLMRNFRNAEAAVEMRAVVDHLERALGAGDAAGTPRAALGRAQVTAARLARIEQGAPPDMLQVLEELKALLDRAGPASELPATPDIAT